ncbi:Uncharacterised protein [Mycobacteroides abscessus subsp. abscessus]|nr:Uncharacterised protein [Mycobacteroides abscessus subsp. abscessus]
MVGIADCARREVDTAEADDDITLPRPGLVALTGVGAESLDADVHGRQFGTVPDDAVDDKAGPAAGDGEPSDYVAH